MSELNYRRNGQKHPFSGLCWGDRAEDRNGEGARLEFARAEIGSLGVRFRKGGAKMNLDRRDFVKGSVAAVGVAAATGLRAASQVKGINRMKKVALEVLAKENAFRLIGSEWMLVCAGRKDRFNMMTASWGGIGWLWNRPVAFAFVRPERYTHEFMERDPRFTLSFFKDGWKEALKFCGSKSGRDFDKCKETGLAGVELATGAVAFAQARLVLDCRKLFKAPMAEANFVDREVLAKWYGSQPGGSLHDVYVGEIEGVYEGETVS